MHYIKWRIWVFYKTSRQDMFCKKGVLKNFVKFTGKYLCQSLFFNKVAGRRQWSSSWSGALMTNVAMSISLHTKKSFPLRISSVNMTIFTVSRGFGHIRSDEILNGKLHFLVSYKTDWSNDFERCLLEEIRKCHGYLKTSVRLFIPSPI